LSKNKLDVQSDTSIGGDYRELKVWMLINLIFFSFELFFLIIEKKTKDLKTRRSATGKLLANRIYSLQIISDSYLVLLMPSRFNARMTVINLG